jgi:hypothetical protein
MGQKIFCINVTETSTTKFEVKAFTEDEAKDLISQFYNGFDSDFESFNVKDLSTDFEKWEISDIEELKIIK